MELVDKLMQKVLDDETFKLYNEGMGIKQENLEQEVKVLESKLPQERENKDAIHELGVRPLLNWTFLMKIFFK
ncbi:hypothetical protein ACP8HI_00775 [Paenibacillus sp. FA6]|uniref:hypothetical protein n=1 Tax=Paenibacillus sp. FA6 TaxID=3413029 RepID=UPI003F6560A4